MSDDKKVEEFARLQQVNGLLQDSLKRCRMLLNDYQTKLAANSNEPASEGVNKDRGPVD